MQKILLSLALILSLGASFSALAETPVPVVEPAPQQSQPTSLDFSAPTPPAAPIVPAQQPALNSYQSTGGMEVKDFSRSLMFTTPNSTWGITTTPYAVSITNSTYFDAFASLQKSIYNVATAQEAYNKKREELKNTLPGAEIYKENEALLIGNIPAVSITYKDPAQQKIFRDITFLHKGIAYHLTFGVRQENFEKVKQDFGAILRGIQPF